MCNTQHFDFSISTQSKQFIVLVNCLFFALILIEYTHMIFRILGAIGLLFITYGVLTKKEVTRNIVFILGGLSLLSYSAYLKDPIFIPLQIIFTLASIYELLLIQKIRHNT